MAKCLRCGSENEVITIPIELNEPVTALVTLCKSCVLNGFKGVVEELIDAEREISFEQGHEDLPIDILNNIIDNIPIVEKE